MEDYYNKNLESINALHEIQVVLKNHLVISEEIFPDDLSKKIKQLINMSDSLILNTEIYFENNNRANLSAYTSSLENTLKEFLSVLDELNATSVQGQPPSIYYLNKFSEIETSIKTAQNFFDNNFLNLINKNSLQYKTINDATNEINKLNTTLKQLKEATDDFTNLKLPIYNTKTAELEDRLNKLNSGVSRIELAHYFKQEHDTLTKHEYGWLSTTMVGMYFLLDFAKDCLNLFAKNELIIGNYLDLLPRFPIFMILIWFIWFCSKQYSYTKQIRDEYEYKYALSMSYLGYRDEALKLSKENEKLLPLLLGSVINNIATSPVQSVKKDCHMPFSEVLSSLKDLVPNKSDIKE